MSSAGFSVSVSDLPERLATEKDCAAGYDLADFLIRRDMVHGWVLAEEGYPLFWDVYG